MNDIKRKLIVFESDCTDDIPKGEKQYIKCTNDRKYGILYLPVIAPRYLKEYLYENGYEVGYEIESYDDLNKFEDKIYTFTIEGDSYKITKGIELIKKRILLVDKGMNINLNLPKYNYEITNNGFKILDVYNNNDKSYCYVASDEELTSDSKKIMLPVMEVMPGFLCINSYHFISTSSYKKKRNVKKSTNYKNRK